MFPEFLNHTLIYFYYKGILLILLDKLLNNLCECIICISKTIIEGQFKVFQFFKTNCIRKYDLMFGIDFYSYVLHNDYMYIYLVHLLKNMDNTCNNYTSIL